MKSVKGFKAFNKGLVCRGFQYEEGKTYEEEKADLCNRGFHFCENPLDVLDFYDLTTSEFATVEAFGNVKSDDKKSVTTKIKIGEKLDLPGFIKASIDFVLEKCKRKNDGYASQLAASGYASQIAASGDYSKLELNGKYSVGACIGYDSKIKGKIGCWITLAEWESDDDLGKLIPVCVKSAQIDGENLKEDVFYKLEKGEFVEAE